MMQCDISLKQNIAPGLEMRNGMMARRFAGLLQVEWISL